MIDIGKILKRAWHILWSYKVLWIFGVLLALTAGGTESGGGGSSGYRFNGSNNNNPNFQPGPFLTGLNDWFQQNIVPFFTHPDQYIATFIWIGVGLLLFILVVGILAAILRYVSESAVIRMVDDYEQAGTKVGFKQGWKLGWSRRAFRLWLIDLIISLPVLIFILVLGLLGLGIYLSATGGNAPSALVIVAAVGCFFLFIFLVIIVMVFLGLLRPFIARVAVLENAGVGASFRHGWQIVRRNWKSAGLLWLVMIGLSIGVGLGTIVVFFLLIPVFILTGVAGLVLAAIPGGIAFGISSIFTSGPLVWIIATLVALPFFFTVLFSPLVLFSGLAQVYGSSVWTLGYREMKALENLVENLNLPAPIIAAG